MIGVDGFWVCLVEFLDKGKNEAGIAVQFLYQILAAGSDELAGFGFAQQTAVFKGVTDLLVQLIPVSEDDNGGRAFELPPDLLGQEYHGIALAATLGMPEDAQLAVVQLTGLIRFDRLVNSKILVVAGKNLFRVATGMVKEDEILQQVEEVLLFADAAQHSFQSYAALFLLI